MNRTIIAIAIILFLIPIVNADYNNYVTYGNDNGLHRDILGNSGTSFVTISPNTANVGSFAEALSTDFDGDHITDIILPSSNNNIVLVEGDQPTTNADSKNVGNATITPVVCDFQGIGKKQYVGVFQNTSGTSFITLLNVSNRKMTVITQKITNNTNINGNILCTNFYAPNGDPKNYLFWLDTTKHLHTAYWSGTSIIESISDPESGVTKQTTGTYAFNQGSHTIALSQDFDDTRNTIAYTAGDYIIGMMSDTTTFSRNWQTDIGLSGNYQANSRLHIFGDVHTGNGKTAFLIAPSTSFTGGGNNYATAFLYEEGVTPQFSLLNRLTHNNPYGGALNFESSFAIHDLNNDGRDDLYYQMSRGTTNNIINIYSMNNLSTNTPIMGGAILNTIDTNGFPPRIYVTYAGDLISLYPQSGGLTNASIFTRSSNYTQRRNIGTLPTVSGNIYNYPPQPIDVNLNGNLDFIYTSPIGTTFYVDTATLITKTNLPFTATLINITKRTDGNNDFFDASFLVNTGFRPQNDIVNYGLLCDINTTVIYSERYAPSLIPFQENINNITLFTDSPLGENATTYFTNNGLYFVIDGGNTTFFDFNRFTGQNYRNPVVTHSIYFSSPGNIVFNVIMKDKDNIVADDIIINKTGTNVTFSRFFGGVTTPLVTAFTTTPSTIGTFAPDEVFAQFVYVPKIDTATGKQYFNVIMKMNYNVILNADNANTSTILANTGELSSIEIFTNTVTNFSLKTTAMLIDPAAKPITLTSINTVSGVGTEFFGDGFTATPINETAFVAVCTYNFVNYYSQKHYVGATTSDLTNSVITSIFPSDFPSVDYKDFLVSTGFAPLNSSSLIIPPGGDNSITTFFTDLGVGDTSIAFVIWLLICIAVSGFAFALHPAFGILCFVALMMLGVFIGMMPLWVIIIFVVIAGAIFVSVYRNITSGT